MRFRALRQWAMVAASRIRGRVTPLARTAPAIFIKVFLGIVILFSIAGFLTSSYRAERLNRAAHHFEMGKALAQQHLEPEAIRHYRAALSLDRGNPEYQLALALALMEQDQLNEAEKHLTDVLENDPTSAIANWTMARIANRQGSVADAEMYYHRAIYGFWPTEASSDRLQARFELVDLLAKTGARERLLAELILLQDELPEDPGMKKRVGRLFLVAHSPSHAVQIFRAILRENRQDAEAYVGLGEAEFRLGNYISAQTAFRHAVRLNRDDTESSRKLELCTTILALDPTVRGLSAQERYRRSRELIGLALAKLEPCVPEEVGQVSPSLRESLTSARELLSRRSRPRRFEEATEENLTLAGELWQGQQDLCPASTEQDAASLVLAKLAQ